MSTNHQDPASHPPGAIHRHGPTPTRPWQVRVGLWLLIGIAAFFLMTEHRAHLVAGLTWLPLVLLLACPLIHLFGHGGHGGKRGADAIGDPPQSTPSAPASSESKPTAHRHAGDLP